MEVNNFDETGRFLHEEEYSQEYQEAQEYPNEENWDDITNVPSFESMLTIPNNFLLQMVRNPFEAASLLRLAAIGAEMDVILEFIMEQLLDRKKIQEYLRGAVKSNPNTLDTTLFILQNQASQVTQSSLCKLFNRFDDCLSSLSCILVPLEQFSDANVIAISEFEEIGGNSIAMKKRELAQVEELLIQRCKKILEQHELPINPTGYSELEHPYVSSASHDTSTKISENSQVLFPMSSSSESSEHSVSISTSNGSNLQQQQEKASRCPLGLLSSSEGESSGGSAYSKKEK